MSLLHNKLLSHWETKTGNSPLCLSSSRRSVSLPSSLPTQSHFSIPLRKNLRMYPSCPLMASILIPLTEDEDGLAIRTLVHCIPCTESMTGDEKSLSHTWQCTNFSPLTHMMLTLTPALTNSLASLPHNRCITDNLVTNDKCHQSPILRSQCNCSVSSSLT